MGDKIEVLVEGGKATAAPPVGPKLGGAGVNVGQVVKDINEKTASFKGMQVPVIIEIEKDKTYKITIGTPPSSALIKKEAGLEKGSGNPLADKVADLRIEQIIKIAKMKEDSLLGKDLKSRVKEIIGTCNSMGILVQSVPAGEAIAKVNKGVFDVEITEERTELSAEDLMALEESKKRLTAEIEAKRAEFERVAKETVKNMEGKTASQIKAKMLELGIPEEIFKPLLPVDQAAAAAATAAPKK